MTYLLFSFCQAEMKKYSISDPEWDNIHLISWLLMVPAIMVDIFILFAIVNLIICGLDLIALLI